MYSNIITLFLTLVLIGRPVNKPYLEDNLRSIPSILALHRQRKKITIVTNTIVYSNIISSEQLSSF